MLHTENDMDMSTYFDFWEVAKEEKMWIPDQKSSIQVVSMVSHLQCFHKYDNISDYPLLLAAVTHQHFSGVGGGKRAYSEMEMAG